MKNFPISVLLFLALVMGTVSMLLHTSSIFSGVPYGLLVVELVLVLILSIMLALVLFMRVGVWSQQIPGSGTVFLFSARGAVVLAWVFFVSYYFEGSEQLTSGQSLLGWIGLALAWVAVLGWFSASNSLSRNAR